MNMILSITVVICYAVATWRLLQKMQSADSSLNRQTTLYIALFGALLHLATLGSAAFEAQGIDVGFFNALSFTGALVSLLLVISSFLHPVECLGILVYPFASAAILLKLFNPTAHLISEKLSPGLEMHILSSIIAYSLLSIAVAQSLLLYVQDNHLHNKQPGGFLRALPALETMEKLLFQMIGLGFIVLSLSLLSGFIYLEDMFAQHLVHKTILSITAWSIFALLLLGRRLFGWRGRTAIRLTIIAFVLLMLAYFGSKFVIELVLQRQ